MTRCQKDPTCGIFLKRGLFKDIKNYIPVCQTHKYKYKIHKYTNTAYDEVPERPNMWYIFERRIVQGFQKLYFHVSNAQIQKCKYTNTAFDKVPERPNMWYIFEKRIFQGYQKLYTGPSVSRFGIFSMIYLKKRVTLSSICNSKSFSFASAWVLIWIKAILTRGNALTGIPAIFWQHPFQPLWLNNHTIHFNSIQLSCRHDGLVLYFRSFLFGVPKDIFI